MNNMPRKEINDYVFYKIVCLDNSVELCYVGSTANFNKRRNTHKSNCNNENCKAYNNKKYEIIRANGGWDNFKMIQIGTREQLTKRQAEQIEEEYREELKANMNTRRCYLTEEQKQEKNKEAIAKQNKEYQQKNKEHIAEQKKEYRKKNIDKIKKQSKEKYQRNKEQILEQNKEKYQINKEEILEQRKEYQQKNKEQIAERNKKKVSCECGCIIRKYELPRHKKSKKHLTLIENL